MIETENPADLNKIISEAKKILAGNDHKGYTIPSVGIYPHQVLWDSCFIAIGLSQNEINRLFLAQWKNGMIPHIIFTPGWKFWWGRRIWRSWISPYASGLNTSGVSQPPMLAEAIYAVGRKLSRESEIDWYNSVLSKLEAYHLWLYRERDPRSEGLVTQVHPWETGLDTSPPLITELRAHNWPWWLSFLEITKLEKIGDYLRIDSKFVKKGERTSNIDALGLYNLLRKIRRFKYSSQKILNQPDFAVQDITYNSILIRANHVFLEIAKIADYKVSDQLAGYIKKAENSLNSLWDGNLSQYFSRRYISGELIKEPSIGALLPLYAGSISEKKALQLVALFENNNYFNTEFPIPSVPINSKYYRQNRYWQGPTWINTNWFIIHGLERYGFNRQAQDLKFKTIELVNKSGFYEYFDPQTGEPRGANNFSWTAALSIDIAEDLSDHDK
jgi:hypothetical protein